MSILFPRSENLGVAHRKRATPPLPAPRRAAKLAPAARSPPVGPARASGAHASFSAPPKLPQVRFVSASAFPAARGSKAPHLSLADLERHRDALISASLATSTRRGYASGLKHWFAFAKIYHQSEVPNATSLPLFAAFLSRRVKHPNTILSALAAHFKSTLSTWDAIRFSPAMASVLAGAAKQDLAPTRRSPPALPAHLVALVRRALTSGRFDDLLAAAVAVLGFSGVMRLGDGLMEPDKLEDRAARKVIRRSTVVSVRGKSFSFFLPYHKGDRYYKGSTVIILAENSPLDFNVVSLLELYLEQRDALFPTSSRFLVRSSGEPPFRSWFIPILKSVAPGITGHGLRAGGATFLAERGVPADIIKRLGRWSSDTWELYIRNHPALMAALALHALRDRPALAPRRL